jgi:uncharacterized protein YkwD
MLAALIAPAPGLARAHHHRPASHHRHHTHAAAPKTAPAATAKPALPQFCPNADISAQAAAATAMRAAVLCLANQQRVGRGLPMLADSPLLDTVAQAWTDTMVATGIFSHGTNFIGRLARVGYDWSNAGENIATGFATPRSVVTAWMASTDHCRNILDPTFANIGIGVNPKPAGTGVADAATWTQDFGLLMSAAAPSKDTAPMNGCPYTG